MVLWNEEAGEYRKLIDPSKKEKVGDIRIIEADINPIEFTDMKLSKNRNEYLRVWMVNAGKGHMVGGRFVPNQDNPVKCNAKGVFTVKKEWYFYKEGEDPPETHVPWIAEMMNDSAMQKSNQTLRVHSSWQRNGKMFELMLKQLQDQRPDLKKQRRSAGGLIITNETRLTKSKDRLIADMNKHANERLMHDVCFYNYAGECLSLQFRPDADFERLVCDILDHTDEYVEKLQNYLKGDPTMHQTRTDQHGNKETKLGRKWIVQHYVAPIRDVLSTYAVRDKVVTQEDQEKYEKACEDAKRAGDPPPPPLKLGRIKIVHEVKEVVCPITGDVVDTVPMRRIDFQIGKNAPQPRYMSTLFTIIDSHRFHYDADGMLPMPCIGMTKAAGGRAQRYMCHGHRSRIQAMCHTFDIFPNKKLGICMADALQEAQRSAGYDELERWRDNWTPGSDGMWGKHMDGWVPQVYVTTPDFTPLIRNALQSQVEWARMLSKEQCDPQRLDGGQNMTTRKPETDEEYAARLKESPTECFARVIGNQVKECLAATIRIYSLEGRSATSGDMPTFEGHQYPNLHMFLNAHVNSAPSTKARLLRHSNQDNSEAALRTFTESFAHDHLMAELAAAEAGNESVVGQTFLEHQNRIMEKYAESYMDEAEHDRILKDVQKKTRDELIGKVPIPVFSAVHAPGGALEERDRVEAERMEERLQAMYAGRVTVQQEWERIHGQGFTWHQQRRSREAKEKWYLEQAGLMQQEGVPTAKPPGPVLGYMRGAITAWYNRKHGLGGSRGKRKRGADSAVIAEHNRKAQEKYDQHKNQKHFSSFKSCFKVYKDLEKDVTAWKNYLKSHRYKTTENASSMATRLLFGLSSVMNDEFTRLCKSGDSYSGGLTNDEDSELNYENMREGFDVKAVLFGMSKEEMHDSVGKYYKLQWTNKHESEEAHGMAQQFQQFLYDRDNGRIPPTPPPRPPTPAPRPASHPGPPSSTASDPELQQLERSMIADAQQASMREGYRSDKRRCRADGTAGAAVSADGDDSD